MPPKKVNQPKAKQAKQVTKKASASKPIAKKKVESKNKA
jgi:hypothetical protein